MKIGENYSAHKVRNLILFNFFYFDDLHLQIIESISTKASVENLSAQWAIFFMEKIIMHQSVNLYD